MTNVNRPQAVEAAMNAIQDAQMMCSNAIEDHPDGVVITQTDYFALCESLDAYELIENGLVSIQLESAQPVQGWQCVDDNTPKEKFILGRNIMGWVGAVCWDKHDNDFQDQSGEAVSGISHWMPLPAAPEVV